MGYPEGTERRRAREVCRRFTALGQPKGAQNVSYWLILRLRLATRPVTVPSGPLGTERVSGSSHSS